MKKQPQSSRPLTLPIPDQPTLPLQAFPPPKRRRTRSQHPALLFLILLGDALLINLAFIVAYFVRYQVQGGYNLTDQTIGLYYIPYENYLSFEISITFGLLFI